MPPISYLVIWWNSERKEPIFQKVDSLEDAQGIVAEWVQIKTQTGFHIYEIGPDGLSEKPLGENLPYKYMVEYEDDEHSPTITADLLLLDAGIDSAKAECGLEVAAVHRRLPGEARWTILNESMLEWLDKTIEQARRGSSN